MKYILIISHILQMRNLGTEGLGTWPKSGRALSGIQACQRAEATFLCYVVSGYVMCPDTLRLLAHRLGANSSCYYSIIQVFLHHTNTE